MNRPGLDDLAVVPRNSVHLVERSEGAHKPSFKQYPPTRDYCSVMPPSPSSRRSHIPTSKLPQLNRGVGGFYKPIKRYLRSMDQKIGRQIVADANAHRRTMSLASPIEYKRKSPSRDISKRAPLHPASPVHSANEQPFMPFPIADTGYTVNKNVSYMQASITFPEGMLRPPADCRNQLRVSIEDTSIITPKPSEDYTSRSAVASPTSLSSKAPSFIRPISSFLTKSSEAVTELNWHLKTNGDYYPPTSSTTQSRESSILSSSSRHPDSSMWKSPSWTKVFNGYVSPRNTSRLFQPLKRKKSKATSLNEDYVYTRRRRKTVTQQETVAQREARAYSTPRVPRQGSLSRDQGATSCSPEEKVSITLPSSKIVFSVAVSYTVLFYILPPTYIISVGGGGMLVVLAILLLALACLCWVTFEEVSVDSSDSSRV